MAVRENNFNLGRGFYRQRHKALSVEGFYAAWYWLHEGTMFYYMRAMGARTI